MAPAVLVVDDSMLIRHTVCRYLEERGYSVESATNGVDALERLKSTHPALIITDLLMPRMTGQELIAKLKANPELAKIPIVILAGKRSASGNSEEEQLAQYVIYKDIDIESQLKRVIDAMLGSSVQA